MEVRGSSKNVAAIHATDLLGQTMAFKAVIKFSGLSLPFETVSSFFYLLFSFNLENHDDPKKINATLQLVFSSNLVYVLVISIFLFKIIYKIRIVFQFHPHGFFYIC
jgi:hypothetical protein